MNEEVKMKDKNEYKFEYNDQEIEMSADNFGIDKEPGDDNNDSDDDDPYFYVESHR